MMHCAPIPAESSGDDRGNVVLWKDGPASLVRLSTSFPRRRESGGPPPTPPSLSRFHVDLRLPNAARAVELPGGYLRDIVLRKGNGGQTLAVE